MIRPRPMLTRPRLTATRVDREQAARDREQSAGDRVQAQADRDTLVNQLTIAETDQLTGARMRAAGLLDFAHEIDRARRNTSSLVVAYLDVVGLKAVNDAYGDAAGDAMLQRAGHAVHAHLRSYDLTIRIGGDEFLCVMSGATIDDARARFRLIEASLAADARTGGAFGDDGQDLELAPRGDAIRRTGPSFQPTNRLRQRTLGAVAMSHLLIQTKECQRVTFLSSEDLVSCLVFRW
jgi:GGDEF domain-containing protein